MIENTDANSFEPSTEISPEARALSNRVKERFIVSYELRSKHKEGMAKLIPDLSERLQPAARSFLLALDAISDAICLPNRIAFRLSWDGERSRAFTHALHVLNSRGFLPGETPEQASARVIMGAHAAANEEMRTISESQDRFERVFRSSIEALLYDPLQNDTEQAARELRYQSLVAIWSAIEVLLKDQLIELLNWKPELARRLFEDEVAKRKFELPKLTIEELEGRNFSLHDSMGDLVIRPRDASDLLTLKAAVGAICTKDELFFELERPEVRLLNLKRHLIVHKRGVVDAKYLSQSNEDLQLGDAILVPPSTIVNYYRAAARLGEVACKSLLKFNNKN